jgi:dipeptidyl-peptidase 4
LPRNLSVARNDEVKLDMRSLLLAAALLSAPAAAEEAMTADAPTLSFERVFASPGLDGPAPRQVKLSPDGRYLTLLRNRADDRERYDLWGYDIETREWRMLVDSEALGSGRELSEDEKMQRERARVGSLKGIISYQWASDGSGVLVPLDGDLFLAKLDGTVTRLTDTEGTELNPKLSSMGGYVSFVRDRRLWVGFRDIGGAPTTAASSCSAPTKRASASSPARPLARPAPKCSISATRRRARITRWLNCS